MVYWNNCYYFVSLNYYTNIIKLYTYRTTRYLAAWMSFPPKAKRSTLLDRELPHPTGTPSRACHLQFPSPCFVLHIYTDVIVSVTRSPWFGVRTFLLNDLWESLPGGIQWGTTTSRKLPHGGDLFVFCSQFFHPGGKYYDNVKRGNRWVDATRPLGHALSSVYIYPHDYL